MPKSSTLTRTRRLVSQQDAADYLGVTERTIRNYVSRGQLRAYRIGGRLVRVDQDDLDALLRPIPTVSGDRVAS
jgi:excisionase family DNA binding protein